MFEMKDDIVSSWMSSHFEASGSIRGELLVTVWVLHPNHKDVVMD